MDNNDLTLRHGCGPLDVCILYMYVYPSTLWTSSTLLPYSSRARGVYQGAWLRPALLVWLCTIYSTCMNAPPGCREHIELVCSHPFPHSHYCDETARASGREGKDKGKDKDKRKEKKNANEDTLPISPFSNFQSLIPLQKLPSHHLNILQARCDTTRSNAPFHHSLTRHTKYKPDGSAATGYRCEECLYLAFPCFCFGAR